MCRSIERLRTSEGAASDDRIEAAARQFVRKISGFRNPPSAAPELYEQTIKRISEASASLLEQLPPLKTRPQPAEAAPEA